MFIIKVVKNPTLGQFILCGSVHYFGNQYAQERVHPTKNLSSHDKNGIKPTLGSFILCGLSSFHISQWVNQCQI